MECPNQEHPHIVSYDCCPTSDVKALLIENVYEKLLRPNVYDIGGTYLDQTPDMWFTCQTEQLGSIYLLHLFVFNKREAMFHLLVSDGSSLVFDDKKDLVILQPPFKHVSYPDIPKSQHYVTTYSFFVTDLGLLQNKSLHIAASIRINGESSQESLLARVKCNHDFRELLADPVGSDFIIESADGTKFNVHKIVLSAHSKTLKAMLENELLEQKNSYMKLVDVDNEDLQYILEFIYTGTLKDTSNCNFGNLLMLADRFELMGLHDYCEHVLARQLSTDNVLDCLMVADMSNSPVLKTAALRFINRNKSVLKSSSYELLNSGLVKELVQLFIKS